MSRHSDVGAGDAEDATASPNKKKLGKIGSSWANLGEIWKNFRKIWAKVIRFGQI